MQDNKHTFNTLEEVHKAAYFWYGDYSLNSCCLAENRLARGEKPTYEKGGTNGT